MMMTLGGIGGRILTAAAAGEEGETAGNSTINEEGGSVVVGGSGDDGGGYDYNDDDDDGGYYEVEYGVFGNPILNEVTVKFTCLLSIVCSYVLIRELATTLRQQRQRKTTTTRTNNIANSSLLQLGGRSSRHLNSESTTANSSRSSRSTTLSPPLSRLLLSICICDLLYTIPFIFGTLPAPHTDNPYILGPTRGTIGTCTLQTTIFQFGQIA